MALLVIRLALKVVKFRRTSKVGIGDGECIEGALAVRTHANALENIPLALILLGLLELQQAEKYGLMGLASMLIIGRILHASGLSKHQGTSFGRFYGTLATWIMILTSAVYLIVLSIFPL